MGDLPLSIQLLISWAPFLLFFGFFILFMHKDGVVGKYARLVDRTERHMERVEQLLEQAVALLEAQRTGEPAGTEGKGSGGPRDERGEA